MVRSLPIKEVSTADVSYIAGRLTARRLMKLIVEKEKETQTMLRPRLAKLLKHCRKEGMGTQEIAANLLHLIQDCLRPKGCTS